MIPVAEQSFGDRVREARQRLRTGDGRRWTQGDLAEAVGVERNTVSRWENGGVRPKDPDLLGRLARTLRVSTDWLIGAAPPVAAAPGVPTSHVREREGNGGGSVATLPAGALPARAAALVADYLGRLERAGCTREQLAGAESLLAAAARNSVASTPAAERAEHDVMADVDAAWDLVVRVLRRDGVRP